MDTHDITRLVTERRNARAARDWARADAIRSELALAGVTLEDARYGTRVRVNGRYVPVFVPATAVAEREGLEPSRDHNGS